MNFKVRPFIAIIARSCLNIVSFPLWLFRPTYDHFIFVLTTGRSGSGFLSSIFRQVDSVNSFHEPYPNMDNMFQLPRRILQFWHIFVFYCLKYPTILKSKKESQNIYIETNHLFIKNFALSAIRAFGEKIKLIHLVREPYKVAKSMYDIKTIPGDNISNRVYLNPDCSDNHLSYRKIKQHIDIEYLKEYDDFFRCLWYWYEIERRVKDFNYKTSHIDIIEIKTSELNNPDIIKKK